MKYLVCGLIFISSVSFAANQNRKTYVMTPQGPVRVLTPQDLRNAQKQQQSQLKGVGTEFTTKAEVKDGKVSVFVRGCNRMELGSQEAAEDASDEEKAAAKKLKSLKNGDTMLVKMEAYGACVVKDWRKK